MKLIYFSLYLVYFANTRFKTYPDAWQGVPSIAPLDQIIVTETSIQLRWNVPSNTGFAQYGSEIEYCQSNQVRSFELLFRLLFNNLTWFSTPH